MRAEPPGGDGFPNTSLRFGGVSSIFLQRVVQEILLCGQGRIDCAKIDDERMKDALVLRYFCDPSVLLADHALSEQQHGNTDFCTEVILEYFQSIKVEIINFTGRSQKRLQRI